MKFFNNSKPTGGARGGNKRFGGGSSRGRSSEGRDSRGGGRDSRGGGSRFSSRDDRGGRSSAPRFGGRDRDRDRQFRGGPGPELHSAVCADCHTETTVPFKPTGSKPVLCRDCFRKDGNGGDSRSFNKPRTGGGGGSFDRGARGGNDDTVKRLIAIERKLDMIVEALSDDI